MAKNYVYGSFDTVNEAVDAADLLEKRGVPESNIAIVGDNTYESSYGADYEFVTYTQLEEEEERGWFDKLFNPTSDVDLDFSDYQTALRNGKVLVVIDEDYRSDHGYYGGADNPFAAGTVADAARRSEGDPVLPTDHHADEIVEPEFGGRVRGPKEPNQDSAAHLDGDKETRVTDEVEIEKTSHTDTQSVSETERREELIIDDETGRLEDDSDGLDPRR